MSRWFFLALLIWPFLQTDVMGQCSCTNCPAPIVDVSSVDFTFIVDSAANNDLSDPGQGVCGVAIQFNHGYLGDLTISLTSPSGQTVTLVGPMGLFGGSAFTSFTNWDVLFLPSTDIAIPDAGFSPTWNSDQPWGLFGNYTGSYYPFNGDLLDFNTGPVVGAWTLTVEDGQNLQDGNLLDFSIIFCDTTAMNCGQCEAYAGEEVSPDSLIQCEGDMSLAFTPTVSYPFGNEPDSFEYDFTYIIVGADSIYDFSVSPDLTGYPPGTYFIYPLSFFIADAGAIPNPDGTYTFSELRDTINGGEPLLCGDVGVDSVVVLIGEEPMPITIDTVLCNGDTLFVDTIAFTTTGNFQATLQTFFSCDSVININLTVLPPLDTNLTAYFCENDTFNFNGQLITVPGMYADTVQSVNGCDSVVFLDLQQLNPVASASALDTLTCTDTLVMLDGTASSQGAAISFNWSGPGSVIPGNSLTPEVSIPGLYVLQVLELSGDSTLICASTDTVEVFSDTMPPTANAGLDTTLSCSSDSIPLDGSGSATGPGFSYAWTGPAAFMSSLQNPFVSNPGGYQLTVTALANGCTAVDSVNVIPDFNLPDLTLTTDTLSCIDTLGLLTVSSSVAMVQFAWTGPNGFNESGDSVSISMPGTYVASGTASNGCVAFDSVTVLADTLPPDAMATADTLTCFNPLATLSGNSATPGVNYQWTGNGIDTLIQVVDVSQAGVYSLAVTGANGCTTQVTAEVVADQDGPGSAIGVISNPITCSSSMAILEAQTPSQGASFQWTGPATFSSSDTTISVALGGIYTLIIQGINGCTDTSQFAVTYDTLAPVASATTSDTLTCQNMMALLIGVEGSGNINILPVWEQNGSPIDTGFTSTVTTTGTYNFIALDTVNGCSDTAAVTVVDDVQLPDLTLQADTLTCSNPVGDLLAFSSFPGMMYSWTGPVGFSEMGDSVTTNNGGMYILTGQAPNGCVSTDSILVLMDTLSPDITVEGDTMTCFDPLGTLNGTSTTSNVSYHWTGPGLDSMSQTVEITLEGLFTLTVTGPNGCTSADTARLVADLDGPGASILPIDNPITCFDTAATLDGGTLADTAFFEWFGPTGFLSNDTLIVVNDTGIYWVLVTGFNGCTDSISMMVSIDSMFPGAQALAPDTLTCLNLDVPLSAMETTGNANVLPIWSFNGNVVDTSFTPLVSNPGDYILEIIDTLNGCQAFDTVTVILDSNPPTANAGPPGEITCTNSSAPLDGTASSVGPAFTYTWLDPTGLPLGNQAISSTMMGGIHQLIVFDTTNGCADTAQVLISVDTVSPVSLISPPGVLTCTIDSLSLNGFNSSMGPEFVYFWTSPLNDTISLDPLNAPVNLPGIYTLIVVDTSNGCAQNSSDVVAIDTVPPVGNPGGNGTLTCTDSSIWLMGSSLSAGTLDFQWLDGLGIPLSNADSVQVTAPGNYLFVVSNMTNGCADTTINTVGIDTLTPGALVTGVDTLTCLQTAITLDASNSSPMGTLDFLWSQSMIVLGTNPTLLVDTGGVYELEVIDTTNGCTQSISISVPENITAPMSVAGPPDTINCIDTLAALDGSASSQGPLISYSWSDGMTVISMNDIDSVALGGTYYLEVTDNANGCSATDSVDVSTSFDLPTADAGLDQLLNCADTMVTLDGSNSSQGLIFSYSWNLLDGTLLGTSLLVPVNSPDTIVLAVLNTQNNCAAFDTVIVNQNIQQPAAIANVSGPINCINEVVMLLGAGSSAGPDIIYQWLDSTNGIVGNSINIQVNEAQSYSLVVADTVTQCVSADTVLVQVDTVSPIASVGPDTSLTCAIMAIDLSGMTNLPADSVNVVWVTPSGTIVNSNTVNATQNGVFLFSAVDITNGCADTASVEVTLDTISPDVQIAAPGLLTCIETSLSLDASNSTSGPAITYLWTGPGLVSGADTPNPLINLPGMYTLTLTNMSNGCSSQGSVQVDQEIDLPSVVLAALGSIDCQQSQVSLSGEGSSTGAIFSYLWTTANGQIISSPAGLNIDVSSAGTYTLQVTNGLTGCIAIDSITVDASTSQPVGALINSMDPNCFDDRNGSIQIDSVIGGTPMFQYALNGGAFSPIPQFNFLSTGVYELEIQDALGCSWDTTIFLQGADEILVDLGPDQEIELGQSANIAAQINRPDNAVSLLIWTTGIVDTCSGVSSNLDCAIQLDTPTFTTVYTVFVLDSNGCSSSDEMTVYVLKPQRIFFPNAFSPDGDGNNDQFIPDAGRDVERIESFSVFNRWGELMYTLPIYEPGISSKTLGWDGTFKGEQMPPGVYVYFAHVRFKDGTTELMKGDVTLVR